QPARNRAAERVEADPGVLLDPVRGAAHGPPARVLELLREVPVEERGERLDPRLEQGVDEAAVEVEAPLVRGPATARLDARPRERESVGREPELAHDRDVVEIAVVVVAGDVSR